MMQEKENVLCQGISCWNGSEIFLLTAGQGPGSTRMINAAPPLAVNDVVEKNNVFPDATSVQSSGIVGVGPARWV